MKNGKYLFSQLVEFLPKRIFDGIVRKYNGDKYVKTFTCWNQLLVMMFGQFSCCDSLREVICIIDAIKNKSYHLGFGSRTGYQTKKKYPCTLRRIVYYAPELKGTFTFLTNNFVLKASDFAMLYKQRWQVEFFFYDKYNIMRSRSRFIVDYKQFNQATTHFYFS